jgi:hypothetical protein
MDGDGWRRGRTQVRGDQPEWTVLRPAVDDISTGGQKYLPGQDGSFLAPGLRADQASGEDDRRDERSRRSGPFGSSC